MNNDDFVEVYTADDLWISLRTKWDSEALYIISDHDIEHEVDFNGICIRCRFYEYDADKRVLVFIDSNGIEHTLNPRTDITREHINIWRVIIGKDEEWFQKEEWCKVEAIPFDRNFFKIGNCYMVKEKRHEDPWPMMLIGMDFERLHFIRVADPDCFKDPGIIHHYVTKKQYERMHRPLWFQAMMPSGVWAKDKDE